MFSLYSHKESNPITAKDTSGKVSKAGVMKEGQFAGGVQMGHCNIRS